MHTRTLILATSLLASCASQAPTAPTALHAPSAPSAPSAASAASAPSAPSALSAPSASRQIAPADDSPAASASQAAPDLQRLVVVQNGRTGEVLTLSELLDALEESDVVFLGESHTDETTHRVELAVYEGLLARRDGNVVLAMEMFERDAQAALDDYLAGRIDEAAFLAASRPWGNYHTAYRPLIEAARAAGAPVVASNFPRPLRMQLMKDGPDTLAALRDAGSRDVPAELLPNTDAYWRRVDNAVRGHKGMMGGDDSPEARLLSTQSLWDNSMGESCARALDEHPGALVLHVNGGFHSEYWDGTAWQLALRKPDALITSVAIVPTSQPATADVGGLPAADYVVFAEQRAEDLEGGIGAVFVPRKLEYRFHRPADASADAPVPLLIWLSDDGLTAEEGLELWKERLGDEAAIAVLEAPNLELQADLAPGGRWFGGDDFTQEADGLRFAVERVAAFLLQHEAIDPARICVAGEGTGGTVAAAVALLGGPFGVRAVALQPRGFANLRDIPLPLPELRGDEPAPDSSLRVVLAAQDGSQHSGAAWWTTELAEYEGVGLPGQLVEVSDDPWLSQRRDENELRAALGLPVREAPPASASGSRPCVLVPDDSTRALHWARLFALRAEALSGQPVAVLQAIPAGEAAQPLSLQVKAAPFAAPDMLPLCPGDFGGTTIVVLPARTPAEEVLAWQAMAADDPLNKQSRFHRLRVATAETGQLGKLLEELEAMHRTNVLIVPATFHADAEAMLALQRDVRDVRDRFTLHWLPGLGRQLQPGG